MKHPASWILVLLCTLPIMACSTEDRPAGNTTAVSVMDVYKSPTCGCCGDWIDHIEDSGFTTRSHHPDDLNQLKADKGIAPQYQSCHTGVTEDGFVFEGHVPARYMQQFLAEKPEGAIGLTVPGMPLGSPGMEVDNRFTPYQVLLLMADGSTQVYANIASPADQ